MTDMKAENERLAGEVERLAREWAESDQRWRTAKEQVEQIKAEALEVAGIVYGQLTAGIVDDHDRIMRACNELAEFGRRLTGAAPPLADLRPASDEKDVPAATKAHPEQTCRRCGGPNVSWFAPSPLWNAVMRGGSIDGPQEFGELICPTCFAVLAEERGIAQDWRLTASTVHVDLETTSPSGRVWDDESNLWREPHGH